MGTDLVIKYKGKSIACPGRAYHYHTNGKVEKDFYEISSEIDEAIKPTIDRMVARAAYTPATEDELESIIQGVREDMDDLRDSLLEAGERLLLAKLLEEDNIAVEEA